MKLILDISDYQPTEGFRYQWEKNYELYIKLVDDNVVLSANKEGLVSLAIQLLSLSQNNIPSGYHLHLSEDNSLDSNSIDLIIQKL